MYGLLFHNLIMATRLLLLFLCASFLALARGYRSPSITFYEPEQVHLAYGVTPSQMAVTWSTKNDTNTSFVQYGRDKGMNMTVYGYSTTFAMAGEAHRIEFIHRVAVTGLIPGQTYYYLCGSNKALSEVFTMTAKRTDPNWSPSIVMYGDFGNENAQSLPRLQRDVIKGMYDMVLHVGDFAYDLEDDDGQVGDEFMQQIQSIAGNIPYMTCPGNHENAGNFTQYKHRFTMPTDEHGDRMYYSFDVGPAHIISFNTEYFFYIYYGLKQIVRQYDWLEQDLKEASKPENRKKRPWIITFAHRPMYCSNNDRDDCTRHESIIRVGIPFIHAYGLEKLFHKYGVDLMFWAHEHSYERMWPVFDRKVYNGSYDAPYTNPGAPVHIITGSAGCEEKHDPFVPDPSPWSAFRSDDYGYTRVKIHNSTHLYMEQVSDDKEGSILDKMYLIKDHHGPYNTSPSYYDNNIPKKIYN